MALQSGSATRTLRAIVAAIAVLASMTTFMTASAAAEDRPTLRIGSSGDAVLVLEQRLTELGYDIDGADTTFGADTKAVVLTLQETAKITRDGIVGQNTWAAIDRGTQAPQTPPPTTNEPTNPPVIPTPSPPADQTDERPTLRVGSSSDAVLTLEQRLSGLGYWIETVDTNFDTGTRHAVVALQKAAEIGRDGVVGPNTWAAVDDGQRPSARTTSGQVVEVDLSHQLLLVVADGVVQEVHNTSTGRVAGTTPVGTWTVERQIDDYRYAPLGTLYRPKYFYRGVAIHGYTSVPSRPASHGCVRLTYPAMDHIWATNVAPLETVIEVYN